VLHKRLYSNLFLSPYRQFIVKLERVYKEQSSLIGQFK